MNNKYRSSVKDVKASPGEEIVCQHCFLLMDIVYQKKGQEESKIQKENETVKVQRVRGERRICCRVNNKSDGNED